MEQYHRATAEQIQQLNTWNSQNSHYSYHSYHSYNVQQQSRYNSYNLERYHSRADTTAKHLEQIQREAVSQIKQSNRTTA